MVTLVIVGYLFLFTQRVQELWAKIFYLLKQYSANGLRPTPLRPRGLATGPRLAKIVDCLEPPSSSRFVAALCRLWATLVPVFKNSSAMKPSFLGQI
jgi:hypothetical protein